MKKENPNLKASDIPNPNYSVTDDSTRMASSAIQLYLIFLLLPILFAAVSARPGVHFHPCKTLMISYRLTSSSDSDALSQNPNPSGPNSFRVFTIYRVIRPFRFYENPSSLPLSLPRPIRIQRPFSENQVSPYLGISNSVRNRAKDILVVVVGLLFGVGCGALTAATMYLAWSLVSNRYDACESSDFEYDDEDEGYDDIESPKKMGYGSVPLAPATPVKEGYEGN